MGRDLRQRWYGSGVFEAIGLLGLVAAALSNVGLPAGAEAPLRVGGGVLVAAYVSVLVVRLVLPDRPLAATALALAPTAAPEVLELDQPLLTSIGRSASGLMARAPIRPAGQTSGPAGQTSGPAGVGSPATGSQAGLAAGPLTRFHIRLRAGHRLVALPTLLVAVLVTGFSLVGPSLLGLEPDRSAPEAPTNVRAIGASASQVDLVWDAAADRGSGIKEYRIVRADNGRERIATSPQFHDTMDITGGATYAYRVVAVDIAGNVSAPSRELRVTTPVSDAAACAADYAAPTAPTNARVTMTTATSVTLEWRPASDIGACGLAGYLVLRDGVDTGISAAGTTVTEDGLEPNRSYVYTIVARDNANNESGPSQGVTVSTLARPVQTQAVCELDPPQNLRGTAKTAASVSMAWDAPEKVCHFDRYLVYRGGILVGQTDETSFTVNDLTPFTNYVFTVRSRNTEGEITPSSNSYQVRTATAPDTTAPSKPASLLVTDRNPQSTRVTWAASTDTGGSGLKEYQVFVDGGSVGVVPATPSPSYTLPAQSGNAQHTIEVLARDNAGNASARGSVTVTTTPVGGPTAIVNDDVGAVFGLDIPVKLANLPANATVVLSIDGVALPPVMTDVDGKYDGVIAVDSSGLVIGTTVQLDPDTTHTLTLDVDCTCSNSTGSDSFDVINVP